jgi:hypothetical protein
VFINIDIIGFYNKGSLIALDFPGAEASTSYGTPAFKVSKKLFANLKKMERRWLLYK